MKVVKSSGKFVLIDSINYGLIWGETALTCCMLAFHMTSIYKD